MGLCVLYYVEYSLYNVKKVGFFYLGWNCTLTQLYIMSVGDAHVFPGFFTPVLTQVVFPKPPTTIPTCFCRGERRKYAGKKVHLNWGSNSQPPCHESDTLTTVSHPAGATLSRNSSNTKVERSFNPSQTSPGFYVSAVHVF